MTIGGVLDQAALARLHFNVLDPEQQAQAIGRMATSGHGPETISSPLVSTTDLVAMAKTLDIGRNRLPEARKGLLRDGWIVESVGGIKYLEEAADEP